MTSRGITFAIAQKYQIGYVGDPLPGDERFTGRIAIPYLANAGVVGLNFRALGDVKPKYLKPHGQRARLYNPASYFEAGETIGLAEGEIDSIAATEHLGIPTLGVSGATSFNELWLPLFLDFQRVLIFADGDEAGATFASETAERIGWRARIIKCPPGEDVASMCAAGNTGQLRQLAMGGQG